MGLTNRLGLAPTPAAASAIARYHASAALSDRIIEPDTLRGALAPLPVESLRLAASVTLLLRRLGLKTIADLYPLPRQVLARRFRSQEFAEAVLLRLDQALGMRDEPLSPLLPAPPYRTHAAFAEPFFDVASFETVTRKLLDSLCRILAKDNQGGRRLSLFAYRVDGSVGRIQIAASAATRAPDHLAHLFHEKLDTIDAGFGIDLVLLSADVTEPLSPAQLALQKEASNDAANQARLAELVDRLANHLGADNVSRSAPRESHIPERAEVRGPALGPAAWAGTPTPHAPRPFRLFERPEPVRVLAEIPEGPPLRFTWRRVTRQVARAQGPERLAPEWWLGVGLGETQVRDYYRIEDAEGHRYWLFREGLYVDEARKGPPQWFIHGLFA